MLTLFLLCAASLVVVFFCARFVISEVSSLAGQTHSSRFGVSLVILGFLTSLTDLSVAVNAQLQHRPDISAGNFLGGSFVIIFLILPLLALLRRGLPLGSHLTPVKLTAFTVLISLPVIFALDGGINTIESIIMITAYVAFLFLELFSKNAKKRAASLFTKGAGYHLLKIAIAGVAIFASCHFLVEGTAKIAEIFGIPAFVVSVVLLSLGTNVPEISLAITSLLKKKTDVAFGDYVGSAALNPLMLGVFSLISGPYVLGLDGFRSMLIIFLLGNALFLIVGIMKRKIPMPVSLILIACYAFVMWQQVFTT